MHDLKSHIAKGDKAVEHGSGEGIVLMYPVHLGQRRELQWRFEHELSLQIATKRKHKTLIS